MKPRHPALFRLGALLLLTLALLAAAQPARADLGITSVQPNVVSNAASVELVITGSDFADGTVALLEDFGGLTTTFVSATVLRAMLPAGIAPGSYTLTVVNPDSTSVSLADALTITEPIPYTPTPTGQPTPIPATRPLIVIDSYAANVDEIKAGTEFDLVIRLKNIGGQAAKGLVATFTPGDFIPRESGGVLGTSEIPAGEKKKFTQALTASPDLAGKSIAALVMIVSYSDESGAAYTETYNLSLPVKAIYYGPAATATPTPTSAAVRPQIVITAYRTNVPVLQPGYQFTLSLEVQNKGNAPARRMTMILGGGSSSQGGGQGTPDPGGISGGSGDFGNFAPVASSNVQFLGDLSPDASLSTTAALIVNATTQPGAYPMKITFSYSDEKGQIFNDDQVITLLVYSLPNVEVNFYRQPDPFFAGQPGMLPLQVVNLGRKVVVLGSMTVTAPGGAQLSNNTVLIGPLDTGGYYTLDATLIPDLPGPVELSVRIDYTDDFNQAQVISKTLSVEVQEFIMPELAPGEGGMDGGFEPIPAEPETFWQKVWRFILGLFGLDSGAPTPSPVEEFPAEEIPPESIPQMAPARPKG
ncbi:MAG: IPT/TIG domain-containing protein [Chloroflexi bacterium]|nr:IPT/TIG domain-containing protein [Chloroflexota bacterium]